MNATLRTTLADIRRRAANAPQRRHNGSAPSRGANDGGSNPPQRPAQPASSSVQVRKRVPPPIETNAEIFYYKKQIDAHTPMVIVLQDGEEIEGTIEWYDRSALR